MNPEIFILQDEIKHLIRIATQFATEMQVSNKRVAFLDHCGIESPFASRLNSADMPHDFALSLTAEFKRFPVSAKRPDYHPMVCFLNGLLEYPGLILNDADAGFCRMLVERGRENFLVLKARSAVCRIESPAGSPIGTGVYLDGCVLTCGHVLNAAQGRPIHARFGYTRNDSIWGEYNLFEIELPPRRLEKEADYALVGLTGSPDVFPAQPYTGISGSGPEAFVRMIHHYQGGPAVVSEPGLVKMRDMRYLWHTVEPVEKLSSGAPLFNSNWQVVGIHRGEGTGYDDQPDGTTQAVAIDVVLKN